MAGGPPADERPSRVHGAFVYTGAGKSAQRCPKEAVALQWCLAKRGHREAYCREELRQWEACYERAKARDASTVEADVPRTQPAVGEPP
ncbi:hypothetical protein KFE25_011909 [Diacronema lutheri]|uniref:CHCH domain-containing protein n=1 Tax=Diacronema lutheri TaxID=2081491 RepID=A0A8J6CAF1_DIALT|nr:hypothetical protein KFE25_011909 [Diacronema lutheri]